MYATINKLYDILIKAPGFVRALLFQIVRGARLRKLGRAVRIVGLRHIEFGRNVTIADYSWIEAVYNYKRKTYQPRIIIGDNVAIGVLTHISAVAQIRIGAGSLLGSKIYIGDHSHGSLHGASSEADLPPALRDLGDVAPVSIGDNTWIGDGAVILAGSSIAANSVIGANSVVKLCADRPALIAGAPAKIIRYLD